MYYAIDFGTSNSLLAAADKDKVYPPIVLDPAAKDPTILRSILYFPNPKKVFFGAKAIAEYASDDMSGRLIRSIKKFLPQKSFVGTFVDNKAFYLEELIAIFLTEMRRQGNAHFDRDVESVVLGRPARFSADDAEDRLAQDRLENAAKKAGFKNIHFCAEPLAAAYGFKHTLTEPKIVLVADFGGGTSDFTVAKMSPGKTGALEVLGIGGVSVAGDAFDGSIMRARIAKHFGADVRYRAPFGSNILTMPIHLMEKICSPAEISILRERETQEFFRNVKGWALDDTDRKQMDHLYSLIHDQIGFSLFEAIEGSKRQLSEEETTDFRFRYSDMDLHEVISRKEFENFSRHLQEKILDSLEETLSQAQLGYKDIDLVCATGGTAKLFSLREALAARFGQDKIEQHRNFHSIVTGLAQVAQDLQN